ncbi:hypothetical protein [Halobacteriovorax sp. RT-1-4]|uniref:hypothetical protein n=1 Tax=unclassified Halobacteriovorax TaxID=2639665 RepID=UPI00399A3866
MRNSVIKFLVLVGLLATVSQSHAKMIVEKEEYSGEAIVEDFALKNFYRRFVNITDSYNQRRKDPESYAQSFKNIKEQHKYFRWLKKNKIGELPPATISNGIATIRVGNYKLQYSIQTLVKNQFLLNERPIDLQKLDFNKAFNELTDKVKATRRFTVLDLLIPTAHADAMSGLENTLLATMLYVNSDFAEREWCISCDDENAEVTKKNLERLLTRVDQMLNSCENETAKIEDIYSNLSFFAGDDDQGGFRSQSASTLKNHFPAIEGELKDVSCEKLVYNVYKDEINPADRNLFVEYYRLTPEREARNQKAVANYKRIVKSKCDRIAALNVCMISNYYGAEDIYNDSRSPGQKEYDRRRKPSREYQIRGITQ